VVFDFPGVVMSQVSLGRGEMGFCWKGLGIEPLSLFSGVCRTPILQTRGFSSLGA
jgi:hypothetical protein